MKAIVPGTSNLIKAILVVFACCTTVYATTPFKPYASIGSKIYLSGNGLAAAPALTVSYSLERMEIDLGANFQVHGSHFSGGQANVCWYVTPEWKKVRLGFFGGLRYLHSASLKRSIVAQEKWVQPESKLDFDELKMQCFEGQAGFGLRVQHSHHISTFYGIGFGAYQTMGNTQQYAGMHREINRSQLSLNFSLSYSFR